MNNIPTTNFLQTGCPSCRPTNSVKALTLFLSYKQHSSKPRTVASSAAAEAATTSVFVLFNQPILLYFYRSLQVRLAPQRFAEEPLLTEIFAGWMPFLSPN